MIENVDEKQPFKGKVAIIPGGSKGIGKESARFFVEKGGSVCIIARGMDALKQTQEECSKIKFDNSQFVEIISCDTTNMEKLKPLIKDFIDKHGVPDYLFNFVGFAITQYLEKLTLDDFKRNMDVNYYGQLVPTLIVLPYFMKTKKGYIAFTSSALGFYTFMGYAAYSPSKYALFGLAEVFRHELLPYNIKISVLFPVDTDTPGYAEEMKQKPEECKLISEVGKVMTAKQVAEEFINGVLNERFEILPGEAAIQMKEMRENPDQIRGILDSLYKRARRKTKRKI
ncbi:MAG: SDR family oxidoreductase [Promethearchaeota archaeon]